jgi:hypothetical protein
MCVSNISQYRGGFVKNYAIESESERALDFSMKFGSKLSQKRGEGGVFGLYKRRFSLWLSVNNDSWETTVQQLYQG